MAHLMDGFQRNSRGGISIRTFPADQFPGASEGWYDSPAKVPLNPGQKSEPVKAEPTASKPEVSLSSTLGTNERQPYGAPRPVGRPRGSKNKAK